MRKGKATFGKAKLGRPPPLVGVIAGSHPGAVMEELCWAFRLEMEHILFSSTCIWLKQLTWRPALYPPFWVPPHPPPPPVMVTLTHGRKQIELIQFHPSPCMLAASNLQASFSFLWQEKRPLLVSLLIVDSPSFGTEIQKQLCNWT